MPNQWEAGRAKPQPRIFHPSTDERNRVGQLFEATINCPMAQHYHRPPLSWMWIDVSGVVSPAEGHGLLTTSYHWPCGLAFRSELVQVWAFAPVRSCRKTV